MQTYTMDLTRRSYPGGIRALIVVGMLLALGFGGAWSASAADAAPAFTVTTTKLPTSFRIGDRGDAYTVVAQNSGDPVPAGIPVTMEVVLPPGVSARLVRTGQYGTTQDACSIVDAQRVICTGSTAIDGVTGKISVVLVLSVGDEAVDGASAKITVSGGGMAAPVLQDDPLVVLPRQPFGVHDFVAGTFDDAGVADAVAPAGGHPFVASASFAPNRIVDAAGGWVHVEPLKNVITDLPVGFVGNLQAIPTCKLSMLPGNKCPIESQVGVIRVDLNRSITLNQDPKPYGIYNMEPDDGNVAQFGASVGNMGLVHFIASVRSDDDFGVRLTVNDLPIDPAAQSVEVSLWGVPADPRHNVDRQDCTSGLCKGGAAIGSPQVALLSNPHQCLPNPPVTTLSVDSWQHPGVFKAFASVAAPVIDCDKPVFQPAAAIKPTVTAPDAPTGLDVDLSFGQDGLLDPDGLAPPPLKKATVTLPEGMTINPAGANALEACTDAQLNLKSKDPVTCPNAAQVGTVTAKSPVLKETLTGGVYIRSQNSMDPESGEMFRLALVLENKERGLSIRLPGSIHADAKTGRLVTTFDNNPQLPVSDIKLQFKDGPRAPLATPALCGKKTIDTALTPWGGGPTQDLQSTFTVDCTAGLGWFGPFFSAGTISPQAGAAAPFVLRVSKPDGQSDLNGIALSLPEGLLANLKGNVGTRIGTARVAAGPGSQPFWLSGPVVLEGPYGDAPFSLRVTVPAIAGPFNLGDVVVRQKIYVDPHDAHVTVVSDPLPTIVKGVPVRLQSLNVDVDKPGFMINPTSCAPKSIGGTLAASTGQTASVASRFQVGGCEHLPLRPKLSLDLIGKKETKRGKHPKLSTTLTQQPGESGLKKVAVRLPLSLALDPDNAQALCKPEQAAAKACPAESIIGKATAISPVLNRPLTGDVFFVEGTRKTKQGRTAKTMPKLWVALRGEVALDVWADSSLEDSKYLVTTFGFIPDAPISSFKLDIDGGKHGILVVTGKSDANLCHKPLVAKAQFDGQNGKRVKSHPVMGSPCAFRVQDKTLYSTRTKVRVSGIGAGKLTLSGKGVKTTRRTIKRADVASITAKLTASGKRAYKGRKAIRLKVSFNPKAKGEKTHTLRTTVKRAKAKKSKKAKAKKSSSSRSGRAR